MGEVEELRAEVERLRAENRAMVTELEVHIWGTDWADAPASDVVAALRRTLVKGRAALAAGPAEQRAEGGA